MGSASTDDVIHVIRDEIAELKKSLKKVPEVETYKPMMTSSPIKHSSSSDVTMLDDDLDETETLKNLRNDIEVRFWLFSILSSNMF